MPRPPLAGASGPSVARGAPALPRSARPPGSAGASIPSAGVSMALLGFCTGILVHIGAFKGLDFMSQLVLDPTLGCLLLTVAFGLVVWSRGQLLPIGRLWPLVALWAIFLLGVPFMGTDSYSLNKVLLLFTLCLIVTVITAASAAQPLFVGGFLLAQVFAGVLMCGLLLLFGGNSSTGQRLLLDGGNSIGAARVVGAAAVVLIPTAFSARSRLVPAGLVSALLLVTLIGVGSRGPAVFVLVSLALSAVLTGTRRARRLVRVAGVLVLGIVLLVAVVLLAPGRAGAGRLLLLTRGAQADRSVSTRLSLLDTSSSILAHSPLGVGWGNFSHAARVEGLPIALYHQYPHNVLVEVGVEAGWVPVLVLVIAIATALIACGRRGMTIRGSIVFALAIYFVGNALVSGDITGNRAMWALIGLGLGYWVQDRISIPTTAGISGAQSSVHDRSAPHRAATHFARASRTRP